MGRRVAGQGVLTYDDFLRHEEQIDRSVCGRSLEEPYRSRFEDDGAHDPTPTPYFVLEELFAYFDFHEGSHLLDVGCGTGRVLAHFLREGLPGRATGVELDPWLAQFAQTWTKGHPQLEVISGSALDLDLSPYTCFYLFNPFDQGVLQQFIEQVEAQVAHPVTLIHMSDNGDTWRYVGRSGWSEVASGEFQDYRDEQGHRSRVYDWPQHYTVWHYDGTNAV